MKKSLTKVERLHRRCDIINLLQSAHRIGTRGLTLLFKENGKIKNRVAFFLKKGFKNAVSRNRHKRILRAIYREYKNILSQGFDFIFILSSGEYTYAQLSEYVLRLLKRGSLLVEKGEE
ncbi:MAG: ribonuclease P protein component [Spirochaetales bacterium]|nr:ribonuclease P protein component [Spirochaetales bacterium]